MRKNPREKNSTDTCGNEHPPGCVWGILHIIKYHHWHYIKKRLVHKRRRHHKHDREVENPGNCANASMPEDTDPTSIGKSTDEGTVRPPTPTGKTSVKDRIKARIAVEISKKRGRHHRSSSCPARSQLKRTESMHRFESPDPIAEMVLNEASPRTPLQHNRRYSATSKLEPLPETSYEELNCCSGESCPRFIGKYTLHDEVDEDQKDHTPTEENLHNDTMHDILDKKLIHVKELDADASLHRPKEYMEALDIINVNKELLVKILHDPGSPLAQHFHNQHTFGAKMALSKSETFPFPRGAEPMQLRHKHELIGSPTAEESKSRNHSQGRKLSGSSSLKYAGERAMPPIIEYSPDRILKLNQGNADSPSFNRGENQVAIRRFRDLRQKIKHVIRESKKERHMIAMDAILHKIPHGQKLSKEVEKEMINHSNDPNSEGKESPASSYESDYSVSPLKKRPTRHMRRTSSVFASLDRYCLLYETSRNREAKCHTSERLKLRTERAGSPLRPVMKKLGRISSLPEMKSYNYQNEESSDYSPGTPIRTEVDGNKGIRSSFYEQNSLDIGSENYLQLEATLESKIEKPAEVGEFEEVAGDKVASASVVNKETSSLVHLRDEDMKNLPTSNSASQEEQVPDFSVPLSEGAEMELQPRDEQDDLEREGDESVIVNTPKAISEMDTENVANSSKNLSYDMPHLQVDERDMAEFNYVRDVLEQSGLSRSESLGTWHSDDQPVDLLMFGDSEGCLVHDPDCSGNEEGGKCEHFLLFDLINEVLMEIYGRTYNYCPMPLSSLCRIPLMPAGHHVLKEVWALISWYLSLRPEVDQSLDYVMSRDLAKNDGWMNLQFDSECIGLELEDLIFDELLEEAIWD